MEAIEAMKVEIDSIRASTLRTREDTVASQKTLEAKIADLARQESEIQDKQKVEEIDTIYSYQCRDGKLFFFFPSSYHIMPFSPPCPLRLQAVMNAEKEVALARDALAKREQLILESNDRAKKALAEERRGIQKSLQSLQAKREAQERLVTELQVAYTSGE